MEGHCSTGQSPQWALLPMEEDCSPQVVTILTELSRLTKGKEVYYFKQPKLVSYAYKMETNGDEY